MTILKIRDANGNIVNVAVEGLGTELSPYIPTHGISNLSEISDNIPLQKTILSVTGSIETIGDTNLIESVSNKSIVLSSFCLQNESDIPVTMVLKNGNIPFWRIHCVGNGDGFVKDYPFDVRFILSNQNPLKINLNSLAKIGYSVSYYLV